MAELNEFQLQIQRILQALETAHETEIRNQQEIADLRAEVAELRKQLQHAQDELHNRNNPRNAGRKKNSPAQLAKYTQFRELHETGLAKEEILLKMGISKRTYDTYYARLNKEDMASAMSPSSETDWRRMVCFKVLRESKRYSRQFIRNWLHITDAVYNAYQESLDQILMDIRINPINREIWEEKIELYESEIKKELFQKRLEEGKK